jgi:hypothetical protein
VRLFAIVAGAVRLHLPRGAIGCDVCAPIVSFGGGEPVDCELVEAPARALNLIVQADRFAAQLERVTPGPSYRPAGRGAGSIAAVFVQSGRVQALSGDPGEPCPDVIAGRFAATGDTVIVAEAQVSGRGLRLRAAAAAPAAVVLVASLGAVVGPRGQPPQEQSGSR